MSSGTRLGDAPRGRPTAVSVAVVVCVAFVALAVVAGRDLAVSQGWLSGRPWVRQGLDALDGTTVGTAVVALGVVAIAAGLLVLLAAVLPGRRTHLRVRASDPDDTGTGGPDLWMSPRALAFLATGVADRASGVLAARPAGASLRRVVVEVTTADVAGPGTPDPHQVVDGAQSAVDALTRDLTDATVVVRARKEAKR
jgi:hypothetical protein